jgi:hypothetical protein
VRLPVLTKIGFRTGIYPATVYESEVFQHFRDIESCMYICDGKKRQISADH